nr:hypothetical protein [Brevundimonas naejangsanensis]
MDNTIIEDKARAQDVVDALLAVVDAIEADNIARTGRGGPVQVITNMKTNLQYQAWQVADAFDLPWSGPSFAQTVDNVIQPE